MIALCEGWACCVSEKGGGKGRWGLVSEIILEGKHALHWDFAVVCRKFRVERNTPVSPHFCFFVSINE